MFQTPQQRAGGGVMAGVAPINQVMGPMRLEDGGDPGIMEYVARAPSVLADMIDSMKLSDDFFSTEQTESGSGINLRDITDFLIVDPSDPVDVAIALATAPLLIYPPAAIAAALASVTYERPLPFAMSLLASPVQRVQVILALASVTTIPIAMFRFSAISVRKS